MAAALFVLLLVLIVFWPAICGGKSYGIDSDDDGAV